MPERERNLRQRIQEEIVRSARDFYGDSLGQLEGILQGDRAQLEDLAKKLPEGDTKARIRDMAGSYSKIEESLHRTARDTGAEYALGDAARQVQEEAAGGGPNGPQEKHRTPLELQPVGLRGPWGRRPAR